MTLLSSYWSIDDLAELLSVHWWPYWAPTGPLMTLLCSNWSSILISHLHSQYIDPNQISCRTDLLFGPKYVRVCFGPKHSCFGLKHSCFGLKHVCFGVCLGLQLTFLPSFPSQTRVDRSDMVSGWSAAAGNTFRFNSHPSKSWHKKICIHRVGNSLMGFSRESLVFCERESESAIRSNCTFALF